MAYEEQTKSRSANHIRLTENVSGGEKIIEVEL